MKKTLRKPEQFSVARIYKFKFGNSPSNPFSVVFDVVAPNEREALDRVLCILDDECMGIYLSDSFANGLRSREYCRVDPDLNAIGLEHIKMMYDPTTDEWRDYPLVDRKKPQVSPKKRTRGGSRKK